MKMQQIDMYDDWIEVCTEGKDPELSGLEAMEDRLFARYKEKTCRVIAEMAEVGLPKPGEQFRLVTRRTFNAVQFLEFIARQDRVLDLKMAIYSINFHAAKILVEMIDGGLIAHADILMSNLRNKAHREKEEIIKTMFSEHPQMTLFFCSSHAKVMSCRTASGQFYTIEGSGNLAYNSRVERRSNRRARLFGHVRLTAGLGNKR